MGFEGLLGNDRLKQNLTSSISRGHLSHFYLICGPKGSGKHTLARLLAAAAVCKDHSKPCLSCNACRKVMAGTHPDVITVDDLEKKYISVDLIRQTRADMYIQPNEADRKVYLFPRAQDIRTEGQNALLKILEEPPAYGVFLLLSDNPEKLLPTVRSRCTELKLSALPENLLRQKLAQAYPQADGEMIGAAIARSGGYLGQALALLEEYPAAAPQTEAFVKAFSTGNPLLLTQTLVAMEKLQRDQLLQLLQQWTDILGNALVSRCDMQAVSPLAKQLSTSCSSKRLMDAVSQLKKCMEYAQGNVSVAAICGYLSWHLR